MYSFVIMMLLGCPQPAPTIQTTSQTTTQTQIEVTATTTPEREGSLVAIVLGDMGTGYDDQYHVGYAIKEWCAERSCDLLLGTGDNFYSYGVESVDDQQFQEKFELPYADIDMPFYMTLGNHDVLGDVDAQIAYSAHSKRWRMPSRWYSFENAGVGFFALDTNEYSKEQKEEVSADIAKSTAIFKVAFGHHPIRSVGNYTLPDTTFEKMFNELLCDKVDIYFSGHDHNLQLHNDLCGVGLVVSGGGGVSLYSVTPDDDTLFAGSSFGFVDMEVFDTKVILRFVNEDGGVMYTHERFFK